MLPDNAVSLSETATPTTSFDPWDAPYFGAATYFSYQATLWYAEDPVEATETPAASSPPVEHTPGDSAAANQSGEKTLVRSDTASHRRRSWWARLFG
jgi:hypothetical protein